MFWNQIVVMVAQLCEYILKKITSWCRTWVPQSVECQLSDSCGIESHVGLCTGHEACLGFSLSLPLTLSPACSLSLSLSLKNIIN